MLSFKNCRVYVEGKNIIKTDLTIKDGKFCSFSCGENHQELQDDLMIIPGLIDQHIHGINGSDAMNNCHSDLENIANSLLKDGVTSFLFTTMTMSEHTIIDSLLTIDNFIAHQKSGANALGVHLEGPFISPVFAGAQNPLNIQTPTIDNIKKYLNVTNKIKIVTFAYEECEQGFVEFLKNHDIVPSIGHSNCDCDTIKKGFKEGIVCATHTYNAMKGIHHRDIGIVGEVMLDDTIYAELICDLKHVSKDAIKLLHKTKPKDKIILITDSMEARHLNDGVYSLGGQKVVVSNGVARLENNTLAGSILNLNEAILNIKNVLNISLEEAIDMATINPARLLKIDTFKGSIAINKDADFIVVDKDMNVYATFTNGKEVYKCKDYLK